MSFGMEVCLDYGMLIFGKLGSKVKVENPQKYAFYGPFLVTEVKCVSDQSQGGSGGVLLAVCQLNLASCNNIS